MLQYCNRSLAQQRLLFVSMFAYLRWRVIDGHLDGLAHCVDVDHRQDMAITDLKQETNGTARRFTTRLNLAY